EETLMKFCPARIRKWALGVICVLAAPLFAQSGSVRLRGQVADPSGAVIPGASISVKGPTGSAVAAKSDGAGLYEVRNLAPGKYAVTVTAKGFAPQIQD